MKTYAPRIVIRNITTKLPVTEIAFNKTPGTLATLEILFKSIKASGNDFFLMTLATEEITIVCSDTLVGKVEKAFKEKPKMKQSGLTAVGLSFDEKYYDIPNVTFSLIRKIALREINIAETVSSYKEVVFICNQKDLNSVLDAFSN